MGAIKFKYIVNKEFRLELLHFEYYSGHLYPIITETEAHFEKRVLLFVMNSLRAPPS